MSFCRHVLTVYLVKLKRIYLLTYNYFLKSHFLIILSCKINDQHYKLGLKFQNLEHTRKTEMGVIYFTNLLFASRLKCFLSAFWPSRVWLSTFLGQSVRIFLQKPLALNAPSMEPRASDLCILCRCVCRKEKIQFPLSPISFTAFAHAQFTFI